MTTFADDIFLQIIKDFYDVRIMSNLVRPHYVERMVAAALGDGWHLVSADWAGWDIEGDNGIRIEVKQSAARQTWTGRQSLEGRSTRGVFDIAPRTGFWTDRGAHWLAFSGRPADLYIFAWHPVEDAALADHREPAQWQFFVVPEAELPTGQRASRSPRSAVDGSRSDLSIFLRRSPRRPRRWLTAKAIFNRRSGHQTIAPEVRPRD